MKRTIAIAAATAIAALALGAGGTTAEAKKGNSWDRVVEAAPLCHRALDFKKC